MLNRRLLIRLALTAATLGMVLYYVFHGRALLNSDLKLQLQWPWLGASLALSLVLFFGRAWKWQRLIQTLDRTVSFRDSVKSYLGGMPLALVTPGRLGELSRCLFLPQKALHTLTGAGRVVLDNWTDFLAVLAWSAVGMDLLWGWQGLVLGLSLAVLFSQLGLWSQLLEKVMRLLPPLKGLTARLQKEIPKLADLGMADYLTVIGMGILLYGLEWLQLGFLLRFLGNHPAQVFILGGLMALATLANSFQVTVAGIGVREGLAVLLLMKAGIDNRLALIAAFLQFVLNLMIPALLGLAVKNQSKVMGNEKKMTNRDGLVVK